MRWMMGFTVILCLLCANVVPVKAVSAQAAIVVEQSTGRVLWEHNADAQLPMASTTKIMTALCVLEQADLQDVVTITEEMSGIEGSSMYLEAGEELTVEQLLYGLMLRSGNDAAVALAIHIGGSVEGFVEKMNEKAEALGLTQTRFMNPHGLPAEGHYTTARELAVITAAAYENEVFRTIVGTERMVVPWKGHPYDRAMANKNKILTLYEGGNGVKTGYTKAAGRCLVAGAEREDMQLICVVLNAPDMWNDCMSLMDDAFAAADMVEVMREGAVVGEVGFAFSEVRMDVIAGENVRLPLMEGEEAKVVFHLPENIETSVAQGEQIGYAIIVGKGTEEVRVPLLAAQTVEMPVQHRYGRAVEEIFRNWYFALCQ